MKRYSLICFLITHAVCGMGGWFAVSEQKVSAKTSVDGALPVWVYGSHQGYQKYFKTDLSTVNDIVQYRLYSLAGDPLASLVFVIAKNTGAPSKGDRPELYHALGDLHEQFVYVWSQQLIQIYQQGKLLMFDNYSSGRFIIK